MIDLKNKTAIITAGKGKIGKSLTEQFKKLGAIVYDLDITDGFDLRSKSFVFQKYSEIFSKHGKVDILINNAGVSVFEDFMDRTEDSLDYVYDVNLKGTLNSIQSFIKCYDSSPQTSASIVNIGSLYGIVSPDFRVYNKGDRKNSEIYGATKAGIIQMTKYLAVYLADKNIRVNCVSPGGVFNQDNPQSEDFIKKYSNRCPMKRMAKDTEMVDGIAYLASDISSYVNGHNLVIDGGYTAW